MAWRRRLLSASATLARVTVGLVAILLLVIAAAIAAVQTGWAKNRIRGLIVTQANEYLTATLSIGGLSGSLFRGIQLDDVTVSRDGHPMIHLDQISVAYSIRELLQRGVVIRNVSVVRPRIVASRQANGRWDLGTLVKRESREAERTGPSRPIEVQKIQIVDARISLRNPVAFGAAHIPTEFESLNASFSFIYVPVRWSLDFDSVSWLGRDPALSVSRLSGRFGRGPTGWYFERFSVETARSAFTLAGTIDTGAHPTVLDLHTVASRFAFQEWSGVIRGLSNIAVEASFDTSLKGPVTALATTLQLEGNGGAVTGRLTLDTSVPGWHGAGAVDVTRLDLSRWLNRVDRPSDISGHVTFDLALQLGQHFPRGIYAFAGRHAMYLGYAGDDVRANGQITMTEVRIGAASAVAYGAVVQVTDGSIGLDAPFPFRFQGTTSGVDLRRVPANVPVPHVESLLTLEYDVTGRFSDPFIAGRATFGRSEFLDATIETGTTGSIDTSQQVRYSGEGSVTGLELRRFGEGLDVAWMREPRDAAIVDGNFHVEGSGRDATTLTLHGGGRLARAAAFNGVLSNADVTVDLADGTLRASFDGTFDRIDPSVPFDDARFGASLTGTGRMTGTFDDLLTRSTTLSDATVEGALSLTGSTIREFHLDRGELEATLANSTLTVTRAEMSGAEINGHGQGSVGVGDGTETDFSYDLSRVDLARVRPITGIDMSGTLATKGVVAGPAGALRAKGDATIADVHVASARAVSVAGTYDATIRPGGLARASLRTDALASLVTVGDQPVQEASGTITLDAQRLGFELTVVQREGRRGTIAGSAVLDIEARTAALSDASVALGSTPWQLAPETPPPTVSWTDAGFAITPATLVNGAGDQRIAIEGTWKKDGSGALHVTATHVSLDTLAGAFKQPTQYGGLLDASATIRGTRARPRVDATLSVTAGRVERVSYQRLGGRIDYADDNLQIDLRLDQSPGVWITAAGTVPLALFRTNGPEQPVDVAIKSSGIDLALLEGLTSVVRNVHGSLVVDLKAIGTSRDPHFDGSVRISGAGFIVDATGAAYRNATASVGFAPDRLTVESMHVEDANGRSLDLRGSLGTHELRLGELEIEATARRFEVLRNEFGRLDIDAALRLRGQAEAPRITGDLTISSGELRVDEILQQVLFRPYSTQPTAISQVDAVTALNPWDRLGLDVSLHTPNTLHLTGENVQVAQGAPIGIGDINLRVIGDLYLYKDAGSPMSVTGSFDRVTGTFLFQSRRFDVDPVSSINFRGDLSPELYVSVKRVISGVEARVSITGPIFEPELHLASTPPLESSDILSLIVFDTPSNQLSAGQEQELVVRAATLAAGFIATPIVSAIQSELGIDVFEIEPSGEFGYGPRVTVGEEIAPGLVARYSRQFGLEPYDEATIEYTLSRIFRLRGTFSDAQSLNTRSPFRRVERAGIDLLLFFSF